MIRPHAWHLAGAIALLLSLSLSGPPAAADDPLDEAVHAGVAAGVERFEKYTFRRDDRVVGPLADAAHLSYALLGYVGRDEGFSEMMFGAGYLHALALPKVLFQVSDPRAADVVAILTEGSLDEPSLHWLSSLLGVPDRATSHEDGLFGSSCVVTHLYVDGRLAKTIASIDVMTSGRWPLSNHSPNPSVIPAACLIAGIATHAGLHGVIAFPPEEFVTVTEKGLVIPQGPIIRAMADLYFSGVREGMTKDEAKRRVGDYLTPKVRWFYEHPTRPDGGP